ncbi:hypothetical protein EC586_04050 [Helicobacter pylori]|nr:hypothetical protein ECC34_04865 [Helicobacter pylori]RVZ75788.1 hypothetical protein EC586_04050 [Helicobacter pylori]
MLFCCGIILLLLVLINNFYDSSLNFRLISLKGRRFCQTLTKIKISCNPIFVFLLWYYSIAIKILIAISFIGFGAS